VVTVARAFSTTNQLEIQMQTQIRHLKGDDVPKAWRPTWAVCWVVEVDGQIIAGPYASREEAEAAASGEEDPKLSQTPAP